ncbi:MAG: hypothetical protein CL793_07450 [Chloroflexi bacterium]|nr:hypothetical protein [Chloroflexota bacterium]
MKRPHRRRPYVKIATSVLREPWSSDQLATFVRLCCWLSDRWARDQLSWEEACSATLSRHDLAVITGRAQLAHSRRALRSLGEHVSLAISVRGDYTLIFWPKYADFQDLPGRIPGKIPQSAPAPAPAHAHASNKRRTGKKKALKSANTTTFPEAGSDEFKDLRNFTIEKLRVEAPEIDVSLIDQKLTEIRVWSFSTTPPKRRDWKEKFPGYVVKDFHRNGKNQKSHRQSSLQLSVDDALAEIGEEWNATGEHSVAGG